MMGISKKLPLTYYILVSVRKKSKSVESDTATLLLLLFPHFNILKAVLKEFRALCEKREE